MRRIIGVVEEVLGEVVVVDMDVMGKGVDEEPWWRREKKIRSGSDTGANAGTGSGVGDNVVAVLVEAACTEAGTGADTGTVGCDAEGDGNAVGETVPVVLSC